MEPRIELSIPTAILSSLLLLLVSTNPLHFLPNPLPRNHQRLPQQILPPLLPRRPFLLPRPQLLRTEPHAPNSIEMARLHQFSVTSCQQLRSQAISLFRIDSARELIVAALFNYTRLVPVPDFVVKALDALAEGFAFARTRTMEDLGCYTGVGKGEGFVVHHVSLIVLSVSEVWREVRENSDGR
jgi:hypothetical protein